ncbi:MAG: isopenicillin N synthase family oxygenase [Alphaproteobacteria bacterium]|nr:isopenicillin N synthase family oxygenase [Alphaproteobacteria bacterium]
MNYATARTIDVSAIPVIDMAPLIDGGIDQRRRVAAEFRRAAAEVGFFYVKNHNVAQPVIDRALDGARRFFALPDEAKNQVRVRDWHRGFLKVGQAKMYDDAKADLKESFIYGLEIAADDPDFRAGNLMVVPNRWPAAMPDLRDALYLYFTQAMECGRTLLRGFALGMDLPEDSFVSRWRKSISRGAALYYPPQPPNLGREQFGVAPHTDFGVLTVLWQDDSGGLQVLNKQKQWVTAHPIPGTLVVNVGDLLARWTNDGFASTPHRVVNTTGHARYSMPVAVDPDHDTLVDPRVVCRPGETPRYEPITCGDYLNWRFNKAFAYRKA